jgi:nucleoside-diphosphate-sugar epimerase
MPIGLAASMTQRPTMRCAVTGYNGYVGSVLQAFLLSKDYEIFEMGRIPNAAYSRPHHIHFSLGDFIDPEVLKHLDVLIHCAYDFRLYHWNDIEKVNVLGSQRLFEAAEKAGIHRLIVISTMSAFENCPSMYGRAKLLIEAAAISHGAVIIRPGLVYGPKPGGMIGSLKKVVSKSPLVPIIGRGEFPFYLTHQDDLAQIIWKACEGEIPPGRPVSAVSGRPISFVQILKILARPKKIIPVPIPAFPVWLALRMLEKLRMPAEFRSDSLVSLLHQNQTPSFELTRQCGIPFRDFSYEALQ